MTSRVSHPSDCTAAICSALERVGRRVAFRPIGRPGRARAEQGQDHPHPGHGHPQYRQQLPDPHRHRRRAFRLRRGRLKRAHGPCRIETMTRLLVGKDPLAIEVHFHNMTTLMHTYMAHIPRSAASTSRFGTWPGRSWASRCAGSWAGRSATRSRCTPRRLRHAQSGLVPRMGPAHKGAAGGVHRVQGRPRRLTGVPAMGRFFPTLGAAQLGRVARGFAISARRLARDRHRVHCHNEYDTPSAIGIAKAVEPMQPMFLETL